MGLFDFFKRAGQSLAPGKAKAAPATIDSREEAATPTAEEIKAAVVAHLPEAKDLTFTVEGDTVKISGSASQETREKAIVAAGNIAGVARIDENVQVVHQVQPQAAPAPAQPAAQAPAQPAARPATTAAPAPAAAPAQPQTQVAAARTTTVAAATTAAVTTSAPAAPVADSTYVMVEKGDTLWKIAARAYGDGSKYQRIFEANRPMLSHPDKIYPGQTLRVPPK